MVLQPFGQELQAQGELAPPRAVPIELVVEGSGHYCNVPERSNIAPSSRFLTVRALVRCALALANTFDGRPAHAARLARAVVHHRLELEIARLAARVREVAQRAAAFVDGAREHVADRLPQLRRARPADARRRHGGTDAGEEQGFGRVDVADADHDVAG